jgi:hypothetical protein
MTGSIGPTGSSASLTIFAAGNGPNSQTITANVPTFLTNTTVITSTSATAQYLILVNLQARGDGNSEYLLSTIGNTVGNTVPTVANTTNMSNNVLFSTTEIAIASGNTFLMAGSTNTNANALIGHAISYVDTPGVGTFTYSVRVLSNATITINQFYMNIIRVSA